MTSPTQDYSQICMIYASLWRPSRGALRAQVFSALRTAEDVKRDYGCTDDDPEALAVFYDDVYHETKQQLRTFCAVLADVTSPALPIW